MDGANLSKILIVVVIFKPVVRFVINKMHLRNRTIHLLKLPKIHGVNKMKIPGVTKSKIKMFLSLKKAKLTLGEISQKIE